MPCRHCIPAQSAEPPAKGGPHATLPSASTNGDSTPEICNDKIEQDCHAGRYPIDVKQRHLENAFVCPCIFLLFFSIIITIISITFTIVTIIITTIVTIMIVIIRKSSSSSSSSSSSGHPHHRHHQGHHHHFITGKVKASDSPCFSAEFGHCHDSRTELSAQQHQAQHRRSALHQQHLS